jgi:hypothetical protein
MGIIRKFFDNIKKKGDETIDKAKKESIKPENKGKIIL